LAPPFYIFFTEEEEAVAEEDVAEEASIPPIIRRRGDFRTLHLTSCFLFSSASASFAFNFFDFVRGFFPFFVCIYPNVRTVTGLRVLGPPMS
jgi:hypothetical protein